MNLDVAPGATVSTASYTITGPAGFARTGTIDVSNSTKLEATFGGLPAGDGYNVSITAVTVDGATTCAGAASFGVTPHATTGVTLHLTCHEAPRTGSAMVNGSINVCPVIDGVEANPAEVLVGSSIQLSAAAHDADTGPSRLTYAWTASSGDLAGASTANPVFTCSTEGTVTVELAVSDGDPSLACIDKQVTILTCTSLARSRQSEAKANLKAMFTAEKAFFQEKDRYSTYITVVGFEPERGNRYRYVLTAFPAHIEDRSGSRGLYHLDGGGTWLYLDPPPSAAIIDEGVDSDTFKFAPFSGTLSMSPCTGSLDWGINNTATTFTGAAYGDIDGDSTLDVWTISTESRVLSGAGCDAAGSVPSGEPSNDVNDVNR
jgi:type IV pilus assembly protein PilA